MSRLEQWRSPSGILAILTAVALVVTFSVLPETKAPEGMANLSFSVQDMNGQTVRLADFRGRPIILNFWATWCGPCRIEIPEFNELAEKYKAQRLTVLGVSVDDQPEDLRKFAQEFPIRYPVLVGLGNTPLQEAYDAVMAIPVTWFIRPDGTVQSVQKGPATKEWFAEQARELIKSTGERP